MILLPTITGDAKEDFLKKLYDENKNLLYHIAKNILKNHALAEEATQEAFLRIISLRLVDKLIGFTNNRDRRNYLATVVTRICYNILRNDKIITVELEDNIIDDKNHPLDNLLMKESLSEAHVAMNELTQDYRNTLILYHKYRHSVKEIAEISKTSEGSVKTRLHRARKKLLETILKRRGSTHE